jgi:hypothetical protein
VFFFLSHFVFCRAMLFLKEKKNRKQKFQSANCVDTAPHQLRRVHKHLLVVIKEREDGKNNEKKITISCRRPHQTKNPPDDLLNAAPSSFPSPRTPTSLLDETRLFGVVNIRKHSLIAFSCAVHNFFFVNRNYVGNGV